MFQEPKQISLLHSSLFFIGGAILFLFIERVCLPYLGQISINKALLFLLMASPHMLFFSIALLGYRLEGHKWSWETLKKRFRYKPIKGKMWLWAIIIIIVDIALYLAVYKFAFSFIKEVHDAFPPPAIMAEIMPNGETFAGYTIKGNWALLGLFLIMYFFNVVGEEFLWRGYLFPKQEKKHGRYTWLIHGLLWTSFHLFAPYNALMVLPGALFMSYMVQKYQNNTLFLLSHAVLNGIPLVMLIIGIIG